MITLLNGDCTVEHEKIKSGSVDLILTDLPYGTMNGFNGIVWDFAIEPRIIHGIAKRILRKNGKMVLFGQEPYTSKLIAEAEPNVPFSYRAIWEKDNLANAMASSKAMVSYFEDILIFSKKHDHEGLHPLRLYFKKVIDFIGLNLKQINATLGHRKAEHVFYVTPKKAIMKEVGQKADHTSITGSSQFALCTEQTYNELIEKFNIDKMSGFIPYEELKVIDDKFKKEFASTFNLWEGNKCKSNILRYKKDYDGYHPTQKPVLLLSDLIRTFSNKGDLVVDLTMGSGSTGVSAKSLDRNFIGIELDPEYFAIAQARINSAKDYSENDGDDAQLGLF
jgi:hypothetical protein